MDRSMLRFETAQDIVNNLYTHFIKHRRGQSIDDNGSCISFRKDNPGKRCALALQAKPAFFESILKNGNDGPICFGNPEELRTAINAAFSGISWSEYDFIMLPSRYLMMIHDSGHEAYFTFTLDTDRRLYFTRHRSTDPFTTNFARSLRSFCEATGLRYPGDPDTSLRGPALFREILRQIIAKPFRWGQGALPTGKCLNLECGAAYCIAGWALALTKTDVGGWWSPYDTIPAAADLLGIDAIPYRTGLYVWEHQPLFNETNKAPDVVRVALKLGLLDPSSESDATLAVRFIKATTH